ncbi:hypothetical protein B0A53_05283 [Rhodotorula sp. CCFEE 5036]|nr:hypothetical protein B0A53_05283 [Rhodotorula sp. CCFEE 5036]
MSFGRFAQKTKLASVQQLRLRARALYKELFYLAKEYPDPNYRATERLHKCFLAHVGADRERLEAGIAKADFIKRELEAMYSLRKYRAMKQRYYDEPPPAPNPAWETETKP